MRLMPIDALSASIAGAHCPGIPRMDQRMPKFPQSPRNTQRAVSTRELYVGRADFFRTGDTCGIIHNPENGAGETPADRQVFLERLAQL